MYGAKLLAVVLLLGLVPGLMAQTTTLTAGANPPPASNVAPGAMRHAVISFDLIASAGMGPPVFLNGVDFTQTGTAVAGDITQWRLFADSNANGVLDPMIDLPLGVSAALDPVFSGLSVLLAPSQPRTFIVAADVDAGATLGNTIILSVTDAQVAVSSGTTAGGTVTSSTMIIAAAAPQPAMAVERNATPIADDPLSMDHVGNIPTAGISLTYDILNNGGADLLLNGSPDAVLISNETNCTVVVAQPALTTIPASSSTSFVLQVTPTGPPVVGFNVSIPSNDAGSPYTFTVQGTAVPLQLVVTTQPAGATGGLAFTQQPVVEIHDASNAPVASFFGPVQASITASTGTSGSSLLGTATVFASAGVATFTDLAIDLAGSGYTLTFSSGVLTPVQSDPFDVNAGAAVALRIATQPGGAAAAFPFVSQPVIEIVDAGGNVLTGDNTTSVNAAISTATGASGAVLGGTTAVQAVAGVVTFTDLEIDLAGNGYTLDFSTGALPTAVSDTFNVAGAADALHIAQQPGRAVANTAFLDQPVVEIHDAGGNVVTSDNSTVVSATLTAGTGVLGGTLTATVVNGVATFTDLEVDSAGTGFEITFSATGLTSAVSDPFGVAGPATQLGMHTQPAGARIGQPFTTQPAVEIRDASGVLVATDNTTQVTVSLSGGPPMAVLSGTLTVTAINGVATFTDLAIDTPGNYTLVFEETTMTLTGVSSDPFQVRAGPFAIPGCTAATSGSWAALLLALGLLGLAGLRRRVA